MIDFPQFQQGRFSFPELYGHYSRQFLDRQSRQLLDLIEWLKQQALSRRPSTYQAK
jgi:hypothetical protein